MNQANFSFELVISNHMIAPKVCPHLNQFETMAISHLDQSMRLTLICTNNPLLSRPNRLILVVNNSVNFSPDKAPAFKRNAAGYVGLVAAVVFPSCSCEKPSELSNEGTFDEASLNKEMEVD